MQAHTLNMQKQECATATMEEFELTLISFLKYDAAQISI